MTSKYIEIASHLRELISKGLIGLHTRLSERNLAKEYNIGRSTISAALKMLKDEGLLESTAKSGTRVIMPLSGDAAIWQKLSQRGISTFSTNENINSLTYLTHGGKIGTTFGLHEEFSPYEPLQKAFCALSRKKLDSCLNTFCDKGLFELRETLTAHLKNYGINTTPDNIVIFHGPLEAIYAVFASLLNQGVNFYYMQCDMIYGMRTVQFTGANMYEIPIDDQGPTIEGFERVIKSRQNMLYVNPINSFPTGLTFSGERMKALMNTAVKYNIPILEND
jgi:GntR family transcriptional regulator of abcA and norABC